MFGTYTCAGSTYDSMYKTQRLKIRQFVPTDVGCLIDLFSSATVMRFIGPRRQMTPAETQDWLDAQLVRQKSEVTRYAVCFPETDELIGVCGFQKIDGRWDFGFYFREVYWGNGYATEACAYLLGLASEIISDEDFQIFVADENVGSSKVLERCAYVPSIKGSKEGELGCYCIAAATKGKAV